MLPNVASVALGETVSVLRSLEASKINDCGTVTGEYQDAAGFHGFIRSEEGTFTSFELPGPLALQSIGQLGINNRGEIVGQFNDEQGSHGFLRHADGSVTTIDIDSSPSTSANDVNDAGTVVGNFIDQDGNLKAFIATHIPRACSFIRCRD